MLRTLILRLILAAATVAALTLGYQAPTTEQLMIEAAQNFAASLEPEQRTKALFPFDAADRLEWHFLPTNLLEHGPPGGIPEPPAGAEFRRLRKRQGVAYGDLHIDQQKLADVLLATAFSQAGYSKAATIMSFERMLGRRNMDPHGGGYGELGETIHNVGAYQVAIFGEPSAEGAWSWRFEGHHLSVNMAMKDGELAGTTPIFLGAEPHRVRGDAEEPNRTYLGFGYRSGYRVLGDREDLGRALVKALTPKQRKEAVFQKEANHVILIVTELTFDREEEPQGLPVKRMTPAQRKIALQILQEHADQMPPVIAAERMRQARRDFDELTFGWAGGTEPGQPHFYRLQGPSFAAEWDCVQSKANHSHSIWRDYENDFGMSLLAEHYRRFDHAIAAD